MHYFALEDRKAFNLMPTREWLHAHSSIYCAVCGYCNRQEPLPVVDIITLSGGGWLTNAGRQGFILMNVKMLHLLDEETIQRDLIVNAVTEQGKPRDDWRVVRPKIISHVRGTWEGTDTRICDGCGWIFYSNGGTQHITLAPPYPNILGRHSSGLLVSPPIAERLRAATKRFRMDRVEVFDEPADGLGFFDLPPSMRLAEEGPLVTQG